MGFDKHDEGTFRIIRWRPGIRGVTGAYGTRDVPLGRLVPSDPLNQDALSVSPVSSPAAGKLCRANIGDKLTAVLEPPPTRNCLFHGTPWPAPRRWNRRFQEPRSEASISDGSTR